MCTITVEVPDALAEELASVRDRLPELLALSLHQPAVLARIYRAILTFLAENPTPEELVAFGPNGEMQQRLEVLLDRHQSDSLSRSEQDELDELERIEHLMVMLKSGALASVPRG